MYPVMLPSDGSLSDLYNLGYVAQQKFDGTYITAIVKGKNVELITRNRKSEVSSIYPKVCSFLTKSLEEYGKGVLVGELTFFNWLEQDIFLTVNTKEETWITKGLYPRLVLHDVLEIGDKQYYNSPYKDRLSALHHVIPIVPEKAGNTRDVVLIPTFYTTKEKEELWEDMKKRKREGIVLKDLRGPVYNGYTSTWLKVKNWRTTDDLQIIGLTEGTGDRVGSFGAVALAVPDGGYMRYVGSCNVPLEADRDRIQKLLGEGTYRVALSNEIDKEIKQWVPPILRVEIEYLGITEEGMYRMPKFKRVRSDL